MAPTPAAETNYFQEFAAEILADISPLEADAAHVKAGGSLRWAVDFSEIYAYCFRVSSQFSRNLALHGKTPEQTHVIELLHEAVMMFFMFEAKNSLWLLEPYLLEFSDFFRTISSDAFKKEASLVGDALRRSRALSDNPQLANRLVRLKQLAEDFRGPAATNQTRRDITRLIVELAPEIAQLGAGWRHHSAADRARDLMTAGRLVVPDGLPSEVLRGDSEVEDRWTLAMERRRPQAGDQNETDAQAVAIIYALNRWFIKSGRAEQVRLLTRSKTMLGIMEEEVAKGLWASVEGNPLRHPRGVLALLSEDAEIVDDPAAQLVALGRWERTFSSVASLRRSRLVGRGELTFTEMLNRYAAVIYAAWLKYCSAKVVLSVAAEESALDRNLDRIVSAVLDPDALKAFVRELLESLDESAAKADFVAATLRDREVAAAAAEADVYPKMAALRPLGPSGIGASLRPLLSIATGHGTPMPFRIGLVSPRLLNLIEAHGADPWQLFSELPLGEEDLGEPSDAGAEWYMAMAYVLGAIGAWGRADSACGLALDRAVEGDLETTLLSLRVRRRKSDVYEDLIAALDQFQSLDKARDERVLGERTYYVCRLARLAAERGMGQAGRLSNDALKHLIVSNNAMEKMLPSAERCEIANCVTYGLVELLRLGSLKTGPSVRDAVRFSYDLLMEELQINYGGNPMLWPDSFLDTAAWAGFCLPRLLNGFDAGKLSDNEIRAAYSVLPTKTFAGRIDLDEFKRHAAEVARQELPR